MASARIIGSAAPLVQPDEPGHTVPGAAPSAKFTKANDPPPPDRAACTPPSGNGADGRSVLQAANSRTHPKAIKRFMASLRGWVEGGQRKFHTFVLHTSRTDEPQAAASKPLNLNPAVPIECSPNSHFDCEALALPERNAPVFRVRHACVYLI